MKLSLNGTISQQKVYSNLSSFPPLFKILSVFKKTSKDT